MVLGVVLHKSADEEVQVIVALHNVQIYASFVTSLFGCSLEVFRLQLVFVKAVSFTLVDKNGGLVVGAVLLDQVSRVVLCPLSLVRSQVVTEVLFTPLAVHRVADWSKSTHRLVLVGVFQETSKSTHSAHGVTSDGDVLKVQLLEMAC